MSKPAEALLLCGKADEKLAEQVAALQRMLIKFNKATVAHVSNACMQSTASTARRALLVQTALTLTRSCGRRCVHRTAPRPLWHLQMAQLMSSLCRQLMQAADSQTKHPRVYAPHSLIDRYVSVPAYLQRPCIQGHARGTSHNQSCCLL